MDAYVEIAEIPRATERGDENWLYAAEENLTEYMKTTSSLSLTTYMCRAISEFIACGLPKVAVRLMERFIALHGWKRFLMFCNFQFSYRGIPESSFIADPLFQYFAQQWAAALNENNPLAIYAAPREKCPKYGWMAYHLAPLCFQVPKTYGRSMHVYMKKYRKMIAAGKANALAPPNNKKRKFSSDSNSEPEVVEEPEVEEPEVEEPEVKEPEVELQNVELQKVPSYVNIENPWSLEADKEAYASPVDNFVDETNQKKVGWFTSWFKNAW